MKFKEVSMPCIEEQWLNEVKPLFDIYGMKYGGIEFNNGNTHLVNNLNGYENQISTLSSCFKNDRKRTEIPYNPIEFIKACGVEVEQPKWKKLTRGGYEYKIIMEDCGNKKYPIIIIAKIDGVWEHYSVTNKGCFLENKVSYKDLIPYNPRKTELLTKKAELEKQLEEINKELNQ